MFSFIDLLIKKLKDQGRRDDETEQLPLYVEDEYWPNFLKEETSEDDEQNVIIIDL